MKHLSLLIVPAGLLLSSAAPPSLAWRLEASSMLGPDPLCSDDARCAELAYSTPAAPPVSALLPSPEVKVPSAPTRSVTPALALVRSRDTDDLRVLISIPQQKAYVFEGSELVATSPVSTGKRGHETPAGTFRVLQKKVHHRSSKYNNAPMPYMQRLTNYGIAIHAGSLPGYPASHGCIRLPRNFAKKLYNMTDRGTRVVITRARPKSADEALDLA